MNGELGPNAYHFITGHMLRGPNCLRFKNGRLAVAVYNYRDQAQGSMAIGKAPKKGDMTGLHTSRHVVQPNIQNDNIWFCLGQLLLQFRHPTCIAKLETGLW